MGRIIFLLIIFALIVVLIIYIVKALRLGNKNKTPIQKTKERSNYSVTDELLKLQNLKEEGIITEKEFDEMKRKLME